MKKFLLDILFPRFCFCCGKEGTYLCKDCQALLDISEYQYCLCQKPKRVFNRGTCERCTSKKLQGLYFAVSYKNQLVKKMIHSFKYKPFIKDLAEPLAFLIITHFHLLNKTFAHKEFILVPIPLYKSKMKQRGFNQAEEIGKILSRSLKIPLITDALIKTRQSSTQANLSKEQREENVKGVFLVKNKQKIKDKKVLLVDDIYTTGATMEEAAKVLKKAKAKEVLGVVIARG